MKKLIVRLALWMLKAVDYEPPVRIEIREIQVPVPVPVKTVEPVLLERAKALCLEEDAKPQPGEYKRHQVYARLIKEFPTYSRRELALAVEYGLPE